MESGTYFIIIAIIIVLLLVWVFHTQLLGFWNNLSAPKKSEHIIVKDDDTEKLEDLPASQAIPPLKPKSIELPPGETSQTLIALGYTGQMPWDEVIQASEIDPSTFRNHMDFVKDVRRFSSGANFTSVTDDNNNWTFTQWQGLRRPQWTAIGSTARQQPDIDDSVLQRNRPLTW